MQTNYTSVGMSHNRCLVILAMVHLNKETQVSRGQPDYGPVYKI
jgi:hypothetical protein